MLYILALISGFFIGLGVTLYFKKFISTQKPKYLRRGIYNHTFEVTDTFGHKSDIHVQFEVGEIERTVNNSKIEVINIVPNTTVYSTESYKRKMIGLVNHTWVDSSSFDWIEDDMSEKRNKKIDQILG
jgi:hypothetical protein